MRNLLLKFSYVIVFIFGLLGIIFFSTVVHEYSHMKDFRDTNMSLSNEAIVINIPLEWKRVLWNTEGVYSFRCKLSDHDYIKEETKYTELKAYTLSIVLIILFLLAFMFIIYKIEGYKSFRYFDEQRLLNNPIKSTKEVK